MFVKKKLLKMSIAISRIFFRDIGGRPPRSAPTPPTARRESYKIRKQYVPLVTPPTDPAVGPHPPCVQPPWTSDAHPPRDWRLTTPEPHLRHILREVRPVLPATRLVQVSITALLSKAN